MEDPEQCLEYLSKLYGNYSILLVNDVPSPVQQKVCGDFLFEVKMDKIFEEEQEERSKKKVKSQRRIEKEKEWHERQARMQENLKAKALGKKSTPCRFFLLGKCKEGGNCPFSHETGEGNKGKVEASPTTTRPSYHDRSRGGGAPGSGSAMNPQQKGRSEPSHNNHNNNNNNKRPDRWSGGDEKHGVKKPRMN